MRCVDFNIHGLVGIRWINPPAHVEAAGDRLLGALREPLLREPDLTYRFVDRIPATGLRFLGQNQYGFTEDAFFILAQTRTGARVKIPFDRVGLPCEIVCEMGIDEAPLLIELIRVLALNKGCVPLHASAFNYQGRTFLMSSWAKGGKTTALLGFLAMGAEFIADDLVLLSGDGETMYGIPTPIEVSSRHLAVMPSLRQKMTFDEKFRVAVVGGLCKFLDPLPGCTSASSFAARARRKAATALDRMGRVRMAPHRAFGDQINLCAATPAKIFILMSHEGANIEVERASLSETVPRLVVASLQEQKALAEHYRAFKFAFPAKTNPFLERAKECHREILARALHGKEAFIVRHPYPVQFSDLYDALCPHCEPAPANLPKAESPTEETNSETHALHSAL
jgi:hypothetical protein